MRTHTFPSPYPTWPLHAIENAYRAMTKNLPSARAAISLAGEGVSRG